MGLLVVSEGLVPLAKVSGGLGRVDLIPGQNRTSVGCAGWRGQDLAAQLIALATLSLKIGTNVKIHVKVFFEIYRGKLDDLKLREAPFGLTRSAFGHCPNRI